MDDLLHYLPFRYEDRVNPRGISELRAGEMATVIAEVRTSGLFRTRRMPIFQMTAGQGRSRLKCIWFNATMSGLYANPNPGLITLNGNACVPRNSAKQMTPLVQTGRRGLYSCCQGAQTVRGSTG